jgi:hypothetical protein
MVLGSPLYRIQTTHYEGFLISFSTSEMFSWSERNAAILEMQEDFGQEMLGNEVANR